MIEHLLSHNTDAAGERYSNLLNIWKLRYVQLVYGQKAITSGAIREAIQTAVLEASQFMAHERELVIRAGQEVFKIAHQTTISNLDIKTSNDTTDAAADHLEQSNTYLIDELHSQIARDIAQFSNALNRSKLEVSIASKSRGIPEAIAQREYQIGNKFEFEFTFKDRISRKWKSRSFVRSIWRSTLLSIYNEVVLFTLAEHGESTARVRHSEQSAKIHGMFISLSATTEYPTYSEVRDTIFHPFANAYLEPVNV